MVDESNDESNDYPIISPVFSKQLDERNKAWDFDILLNSKVALGVMRKILDRENN